jgi:hypothetical protein
MPAVTTAAPALEAAARKRSWLDFVRAELAPTPGRLNATIRIVVATTIVLFRAHRDFVRVGLSMWTMVSIERYSLLRWLYGAYRSDLWTRTSSLFL